MDGEALPERRVAVPRKGLEPINEVDLGGVRREVEWVPRELGGASVHFGVDGEEGSFELCIMINERMRENGEGGPGHVRRGCLVIW